jgi:cobalt-zinc-cadmium efflux system membrane fusion protein
VAQGQAVEIVFPAYPDEVFRGKVLFVSNVLDPDTRRTKVRIVLPNPDMRFKPGMFANVTFFAPKQMVVVIPTTALVLKDELSQTYLEVGPWTFEARPVEVGFQQGTDVVVRGGLKAGDRVVVRGGVLLND